MRRRTLLWLAAGVAMLEICLGNPAVSARDAGWGYGYAPAYHGPPVHVASPPAVIYPGPPLYAYSHVSPAYGGYPANQAYVGYYAARINVLRGPRWDYSAAYYSSPTVVGAVYGRHVRRGGVQSFCPRYRAYIRGPIVRATPRR